MKFEKLNKNVLIYIAVIVSLLLLFMCMGLLMFSHHDSYESSVEWNNLTFILAPGSTFSVNDDSLIVNNSMDAYNMIVDKNRDLSDYNRYIAEDVTEVTESQYNSTHKLLMNKNSCYAVVIPEEYIQNNPTSNPYIINEDLEILEFKGANAEYMSSFIASSY